MKNINIPVIQNEAILPKDGQAISKAEELGRRLAGRTNVDTVVDVDPVELFNSPQQDAVILVEMYKELGLRIVGRKL